VKTFLRFKIKNELKKTDYKRLTEFLVENPSSSIALLPSVDLELVSVGPVVIAVEGFGYKINTEILFDQPIGFEVYDILKFDDEIRSCLEVNRRSFKLSKIVMEPTDLEKDLNMILTTVERIVNHTCHRFGKLVEQTFRINSERLDREFDLITGKEELEKRGEVPRPLGIMHAKSSRDAKERAGDFVPIYMERDKAYLYEDKKVFMLLPRNFAMKLLKLQGPTMIGADQFTEEEREALRKFCMRQYVKTRKVGGKVYYCDLDETTRKLILKGMQRRSTLQVS
jgi:hypothetical protein